MNRHLLVCLLAFFFTGLSAQVEDKYLIQNVTIIPMHIDLVDKNKDVLIENGIIKNILSNNPKNVKNNAEHIVIDGTGKFLIPGYVDAHGHLPDTSFVETYMLMQLYNGVTAIRSMRGRDWHLKLKGMKDYFPDLILSAPPISRRDSFTQSSANDLIKKRKEQGFDLVKLLSIKDMQNFEYIALAAQAEDMPIAGHCPRNVGIFNVAKSKVFQSIEHLGGLVSLSDFDDINRGIDVTNRAKVYHCPTLDWYYTGQVVEAELKKKPGVKYLPSAYTSNYDGKIASYYAESTEEERAAERAKQKKQFDFRLKYLGFAYRQGGQLICSPDASGIYNVPGFDYINEIRHYEQAGLANKDILRSTSLNFAKMIGQENEWGTIKVGQSTNLLLLNSNPLEDLENSTDIDAILLNGKYFKRDELLKLLEASVK